MTALDEFSRAFTSYAAKPERARAARPALLTVLAKGIGTLLGIVLGFVRKGMILQPVALTFGVLAAFTVSRGVGLGAICVALLVLDWLVRTE